MLLGIWRKQDLQLFKTKRQETHKSAESSCKTRKVKLEIQFLSDSDYTRKEILTKSDMKE